MRTALLLWISFFSALSASAATDFNTIDWKKVQQQDLIELLQDSKSIIVQIEDQSEYAFQSDKSKSQLWLERMTLQTWLPEALAELTANCFYGGWPSTLHNVGGHNYCSFPKNSEGYDSSACGAGELYCNPLLFGPGKNCIPNKTVSEKRRSFYACENLFQKGPEKGRYDFLKPENTAPLNALLSLVQETCTHGQQANTGMCALFLKKAAQIAKSAPKSTTPAADQDQDNKADEDGDGQEDHTQTTTSVQQKEIKTGTKENAATGVKPPASTQVAGSKDCNTCTIQKSTNTPDAGLGDLKKSKEAIEKKLGTKDPKALWTKLKEDFEKSPLCRIEGGISEAKQLGIALAAYSVDFKNSMKSADPTAFKRILDQVMTDGAEKKTYIEAYAKATHTQDRKAVVSKLFIETRDLLAKNPELKTKAIDKTLAARHAGNCEFIKYEVFEKAYTKRQDLLNKNPTALKKPNLFNIIDSTLPYTTRRLFVIDLDQEKTLQNTWAALGSGNGDSKLKQAGPWGDNPPMSNKDASLASSEGLIVTNDAFEHSTYGRSIHITGTEASNSNIGGKSSRGIIVHQSEVKVPYSLFNLPWNDLNQTKESDAEKAITTLAYQYQHREQEIGLPTDGCIGIPSFKANAATDRFAKTDMPLDEVIRREVSGGSAMYIYADPNAQNITDPVDDQ